MAENQPEVDIDNIIDRLLEGTWQPYSHTYVKVRGSRPGKPVQLEEYEIKYLCLTARDIFINQPILLELEAPIKICGMYRRSGF